MKKAPVRNLYKRLYSLLPIGLKSMNGILIIALVAMLSVGTTGCKSQKRLAREKAAMELAAKVEQAKKDLTEILSEDSKMTLSQKGQKLDEINSWNLTDPEVVNLLAQAERKVAAEKEAYLKKLEEERKIEEARKAKEAKYAKVENYFNGITRATSATAANDMIEDALPLFASEESVVLIIISQEGDFTDYDRPTTIRRYLEYLKDQKRYNHQIHNLQFDANGKITEIELINK